MLKQNNRNDFFRFLKGVTTSVCVEVVKITDKGQQGFWQEKYHLLFAGIHKSYHCKLPKNPSKTIANLTNPWKKAKQLIFTHGLTACPLAQVNKRNGHHHSHPLSHSTGGGGRGIATEKGGGFSGPYTKPDTDGQPYLTILRHKNMLLKNA